MQTGETTEARPAMPPVEALITLLGVVGISAVFLALCHMLGITQYWSGFMFILYWGMVEKVDTRRLPAIIIGGVTGLLAAFSTPMLSGHLGEAAGLVFLAIIVDIIFCMLMGWLKIAINAITMIFITVGTIPAVAEHVSPLNALAGLVFGVVFFAGFICAGKALKERLSQKYKSENNRGIYKHEKMAYRRFSCVKRIGTRGCGWSLVCG